MCGNVLVIKKRVETRCPWLTPIIIANQEAENRRIVAQHKKGLAEWFK
jgi:hypothetical protein